MGISFRHRAILGRVEVSGDLFAGLFDLADGYAVFSQRWGWVDSLYHSVMLASTVGGSQLQPQTDAGKIFSVLYILVGVGVFAVLFTESRRTLFAW